MSAEQHDDHCKLRINGELVRIASWCSRLDQLRVHCPGRGGIHQLDLRGYDWDGYLMMFEAWYLRGKTVYVDHLEQPRWQ